MNNNNKQCCNHNHCLHSHRGPIHMVLKDGHVLLECCKCDYTTTKHIDHWAGALGH